MRNSVFSVSIILLVLFSLASSYHEERSYLEKYYIPTLRRIKRIMFKAFQAEADTEESKRNLRINRLVQNVPADMQFPCDLNITLRSKEVPTSVDKIRPGDIDVVAAMGDSLSAGNGGAATHPFAIVHEARGVVFSIGGQETWKTVLTLPNILKNFNPNIYGFSLNALSIDRKSKFNVAEGGAISENMPYMAKILVKRIKNDKNVNVKKDWKMVTIFIGHNDFCSVNCYLKDLSHVLDNHKQDMVEVLTILKSNLPRTIVNIVPPLLANDLWNSLLEPYDLKTFNSSMAPEFENFLCPSEENPYISTKENSKNNIGLHKS